MDRVMEVREIAFAAASELEYGTRKTENLFDFLKSLPFNFTARQNFDQRQIALFNLSFDNRSCLGRVAQAGAILEKEFPDAEIMFGEVLEDFFRNILLDMLRENPDQPDSFFEELLMYEEPHDILLIDGKQFEPLSVVYQKDIAHPKVKALPFWEAIAASTMVSLAWLEEDPYEKIRILAEAEKICPGMTAIKESLAGYLLFLDREQQAIDLAMETLQIRPTARALYFLYLLTGSGEYAARIKKIYSPRTFELLGKEVIENER